MLEQGGGRLARAHGDAPGLPRGRTPVSDDVRRAAHRDRLVRAVVAATAERGYGEVTIADVVRRARVSRNVFYEHFRDKESAFAAACADGARLMFAHIRARVHALPAEAPAELRLRTSLRAYLDFLVAEPEFARCFLVEIFAAGPRAMDEFHAAHERFVRDIAAWHRRARREHPTWPGVPHDVYVALVGAMHELVVSRVRAGRAAELPALEDTAVRLYLAALPGWPA